MKRIGTHSVPHHPRPRDRGCKGQRLGKTQAKSIIFLEEEPCFDTKIPPPLLKKSAHNAAYAMNKKNSMARGGLLVFSGNSHPELANLVAT